MTKKRQEASLKISSKSVKSEDEIERERNTPVEVRYREMRERRTSRL